MKNRLTSIVILTRNKLEFTQKCIDSIRKYTSPGSYELIVIDNHSTDGTTEWLKLQKDIRYKLNRRNMGFPAGCNQGIKISGGDSILLLNNDVIATPRWLENLTKCLYSSDNIGAVGPVTNHCSYYQSIPVSYKSADEMTSFAENYNVSDIEKWEERLKLIAFCMLIKREVLEKIGLLDERFSPGNFEDDDYSFRIKKAGYRLMLCKDTFIHHFGSISFKDRENHFDRIYLRNQKKFEEKWGFTPSYSTFIRQEIINLIDKPYSDRITVLEVGCACGATLLKIKNQYKNAELHGIEINEAAADIAKTFAIVTAKNIETDSLNYSKGYFDYIIFADVLEHLYDPWKVLSSVKTLLKPDGKILASIPNMLHYDVVRNLLNGNWTYQDAGILDRTHLRFFTFNEINKMFHEAGYKNLHIIGNCLGKKKEDEEFIRAVSRVSSPDCAEQFDVYQYLIRAAVNFNETAKPAQGKLSRKQKFVTLFPEAVNNHLTKDVGLIAYLFHKYFNYDAYVACYKNGEYPYLMREVHGLKTDYIEKVTGDSVEDGISYLLKNSSNIDVLHLFHLTDRSLNYINAYKSLNPNGKVYLKLDANVSILDLHLNDSVVRVLEMCDLISVETKHLYDCLNKCWPVPVEYIPNGFYDLGDRKKVSFDEKENIICTVGRIGLPEKANEILLEAFKYASPKLPGWKLRLIGPIQETFKPVIEDFFNKNEHLRSTIIFTGEITDKIQLEEEYKKAKIFCLTSRIESFGLVLVEAAKNGCFIISSNVPSAYDVTDHQKYGEIFEAGNVNHLAELLVKNCNDAKKLESICTPVQEYMYKSFYWVDICKIIFDYIHRAKLPARASSETRRKKSEERLKDLELQGIQSIVRRLSKSSNPDDRVFIQRWQHFRQAFKMSFWNNHFELKGILDYPEIHGHILDFGCGSGHLDILLARKGLNISGIDLSPLGITIAEYLRKKESQETQARVSFYVADVTKPRKNSTLFDSVWAAHVFEHIPDPGPIVEGLRNWVKSGAYMLVSVPLGFAYNDPDHVHHFTDNDALRRHFENYIDVVKVETDELHRVIRALCKF